MTHTINGTAVTDGELRVADRLLRRLAMDDKDLAKLWAEDKGAWTLARQRAIYATAEFLEHMYGSSIRAIHTVLHRAITGEPIADELYAARRLCDAMLHGQFDIEEFAQNEGQGIFEEPTP
jgi:hypothetical protein